MRVLTSWNYPYFHLMLSSCQCASRGENCMEMFFIINCSSCHLIADNSSKGLEKPL